MAYDANEIKVLKANSTTELLEIIRTRPYFVGEKSITHLNIWLSGFQHGICYSDLGFKEDFDFLKFDEYIQEYYSEHDTLGWVSKIKNRTASESEAFELFFELYDSYTSESI